MTDPKLLTVPLDSLHRRLGAKMVGFAGYAMPLQYSGIIDEHLHCRHHAAFFDVSHMGQAALTGPGGAAALERVVTGDINGLKPGRQRYTLLMNDQGGIVDDIMVANITTSFLLIFNASRKLDDLAHIRAHLPSNISLLPLLDRALVALQGPESEAVLSSIAPGSESLRFLDARVMPLCGTDAVISRSGYTGEDGFEISIPAEYAEVVASALLADRRVKPAGLGARDSLRLEAGLPLYGNDLDEGTNPIEAGLAFTIGKRRKGAWDFLGGTAVRHAYDTGPRQRLVGLRVDGPAPLRSGAELRDSEGALVGRVTSGTFAPSLNAPIALGYIRHDRAEDGTLLEATLRGRGVALHVVPLPFVPHRYAR